MLTLLAVLGLTETASACSTTTAEDGIDDVDDDCDGSVLTHRLYVSSMNSNVTSDFVLGAGAIQSSGGGEDVVQFTPGVTARMTFRHTLDFDSGVFTVNLRVKNSSGPTCDVVVDSTSTPGVATRTFSGDGVHTLTFTSVAPGDTVTDLIVRCTGGSGTMELDWLTVQNGPYEWAPLNDTSMVSDTTGMPGMEAQTFVRASVTGGGDIRSLVFAGSDQGGFAWSQDLLTWETANGTASDWADGQSAAWDAYAVDEVSLAAQDVIVVTGRNVDAMTGGLWITHNLDTYAQSWIPAPGGLGFSNHLDDCANLDKPLGAGRLILPHADDPTRFLVASQRAGVRGLWVWDKDNADALWTPAAPYFAGSLPADAIPSALAMDPMGFYIVVGFRPIDPTSTDAGALYVCPPDFDNTTTGTDDCILVASDTDDVWAGDVRDIEADPVEEGVFYIADGGRTATDADTCDQGESTVFRLEVAVPSSWPPSVDLIDTDSRSAGDPTWAWNTYTSAAAAYADGCDHNTSTTYGELVPPRSGGAGESLSSVAVDPDGEWLFAFYPSWDNQRGYGCVRTFRVPIEDIAEEATPWLPFQGWDAAQMSHDPAAGDAHAAARREWVDPSGAFMESEPLLETWGASGPLDATFVGTEGSPVMLIAGHYLWAILPELASINGWNTPVPTNVSDFDLDEIPITLAWDGESSVFQGAPASWIATCHECGQGSGAELDTVLVTGMGDRKMAKIWGQPPSGPRPAADRWCELQMLRSIPSDISIWGGDGSTAPQAWVVLEPQGDDEGTDAALVRGVLFSSDATNDAAWCWDAMDEEGLAEGNYFNETWDGSSPGSDDLYELHCQDSDKIAEFYTTAPEYWGPCNVGSGTEQFNLPLADNGTIVTGVGAAMNVVGFADAFAVLAARPGYLSDEATVGGEGLWLAEYDATNGIAYTKVDYDDDVGGCTEAEFFATESWTHLTIAPDSDPAGIVTAFVTSRSCGVAEVVFDGADPEVEGTTTWTELDVEGGCAGMTMGELWGSAISRDGRWLTVYGGPNAGVCAIDRWGGSGYGYEVAVADTEIDLRFETVVPHPHLDDMFYAVGWRDGATDTPGVYAIQHRYRPATGLWQWGSRRLSGEDLDHHRLRAMDWGVGAGSADPHMAHLYVASTGGGAWDGALVWE